MLAKRLKKQFQPYDYMSIYIWQNDVWQRLMQQRSRMHHALLLQGRAGLGKHAFAMHLAQSLLCQHPDAHGHFCGECTSCNWFAQRTHPDFFVITPESELEAYETEATAEASSKKAKKSQQISVEQIRQLAEKIELSGHVEAGNRVVLIYPAETLNTTSANALLKMLEEPPKNLMFLLVCHQPQRLLPTILSRCQKLEMPSPDTQTALAWLKQSGLNAPEQALHYAGGSPLLALNSTDEQMQLTNQTIKLLAQGNKMDVFGLPSVLLAKGIEHAMQQAIHLLQKWLYDLALVKLAGEVRYHVTHIGALQALSKQVDLILLMQYQRKLDEAKLSASHPLNNELQLESLLVQYTQLFAK